MLPSTSLEAKSVLAQAVHWTNAKELELLSPAEVWNLALLSTCNLASYEELAQIRGVSARTVSLQMKSARLKLGAHTNVFAVAEAIRNQLIPILAPRTKGVPHADIVVFPDRGP